MKKPEVLQNGVATGLDSSKVNFLAPQEHPTMNQRSSMQTRDGAKQTTPRIELQGHVKESTNSHNQDGSQHQEVNNECECGAPEYNTAKGQYAGNSSNSRQSFAQQVNRSTGSLQIAKGQSAIQAHIYGTHQGPSQSQILVDMPNQKPVADQKRLLLQSLAQANGGVTQSLQNHQQSTPSSQLKKASVKPPIGAGMSISQSQSHINITKSRGAGLIPPSTLTQDDHHNHLEDVDEEQRGLKRNDSKSKAQQQRRNMPMETSADKTKKNVSPYSIKAFPKFPRGPTAGIHSHTQQSSVHSDQKAKKSTVSESIQPVLHQFQLQQPVQQQSDSLNRSSQGNTNFKSNTSFSQFQESGVLKQHLPPLDPKSNLLDTPGQSSKKKLFMKPNEGNSFLESGQRNGVNVKRIVPTTLDYDPQLLSAEEDPQQDTQHFEAQEPFMYRRVSQHEKQTRYQSKQQMKLSQSPYAQVTQEMVFNIQENVVSGGNGGPRHKGQQSGSNSKQKHSSNMAKQSKKGNKVANQDHSPNLQSRNMYPVGDPRQGVFQSQNLMLVHDPSRVSPQPRPHESHSHTRTMKLRYQQNAASQQHPKSKGVLSFMPNQGSLMDLPEAQTMDQMKGSKARQEDMVGVKYQNFHTFDNNMGPLSQFSYRLNSGMQRDSMFAGEAPFSGLRPESFSDRFSSIDLDKVAAGQQDDLENTIKIGRGGSGDADEDVRLFRDIEIRLKIEPLTMKLLQSITEKIRTHVHKQGKLALGNVIGLLYQQCVKLTQRATLQSPNNALLSGGDDRSLIKQLQTQNQELNQELGALQSEVRALRIGQGIESGAGDNAYNVHQVQELKRRNYEMKNDLEQLRERLMMYENLSDNEGELSKTQQNPPHKVEIIKTKVPSGIPKLNLQKALQINMKLFKQHQLPQSQAFQVPLESSNRGSYMSFKIQNNNFADEEGLPVTSSLNQPLVRPTTTMGGRKKIVFNKGPSNEDQQTILEKQDSSDEGLSEVSGEHSIGAAHPNLESLPRQRIKKHKKLVTQGTLEELGKPPHQPGVVAMSMKKLPGRQKGFHDEFMEKYDEFSLSWREAIDREKRF